MSCPLVLREGRHQRPDAATIVRRRHPRATTTSRNGDGRRPQYSPRTGRGGCRADHSAETEPRPRRGRAVSRQKRARLRYARGERAALLRRGEILLQATGDVNPLSGESFGGTRGVVAHFTRDALDDPWAFGHPAYAWLRDDFLAPLLDDRCDAFVFNVLVVPPGRDANRTEGVGQHVDQTLIQPTTIREQTAFSAGRPRGKDRRVASVDSTERLGIL